MKNIKTGYFIMAGLFIQLAACKVSKDIGAPGMDVPGAYAGRTTDTANIARVPWHDFFTEPALRSLIDSALAHNNDLQIAIKNMDAASLVLKQAKLGNIPTVGLQVTANTTRPSDNSLNGLSLAEFNYPSKHIEDYTASAYLSWEADIWGKIRSQKAAALADFLKSEQARKAVQTQLVSQVAKGYYNLLMLDRELAIARQNAALNDSTARMIKLQYDAGQVTSLAVQQAEAQKLQAESLVPKFEQGIIIQENAVSILTGSFPGKIERGGNYAVSNLEMPLSTGIPAALLNNRPDVRAAEYEIAQENGKLGYAKANMYPTLSISAQGGVDAIKASNWFNIPASLFGIVAGNIVQPIFAQKKLKTAYEVEKVRREQAVISFRQTMLVAVGEVSDNIARLDKLGKQLSFTDQREKSLEIATGNSHQLFQNGLASYLEVITAQAGVLQAQIDLAEQQNALQATRVDLYKSLGGGWQ